MCRTMRAVTGVLIVTIFGAMCLSAQAGEKDRAPALQPIEKAATVTVEIKDARAGVQPVGEKPTLDRRSLGVSITPLTAAEMRIERALDKKANLAIEEAELGEVIARLRREYGIEIQLDRESLEEYDLGSDTLVTCVVNNVSLRSALRLMLRDLDLTFIVRDEVLLIISEEVSEENHKTRIYDVADLVTYRDEKGELWSCYDPLIEVITSTVEPESWMEMGGSGFVAGCDISTAKVLVVTQRDEVHRQLAGVLTVIRRVVAASPGDGQPPRRSREQADQPRGTAGAMGGTGGTGAAIHGGGGHVLRTRRSRRIARLTARMTRGAVDRLNLGTVPCKWLPIMVF